MPKPPPTRATPSRGRDAASVFRETAPFAWRVLRRLGVDEADVDDVCQEVFVVVHRRLADFEGRSSLRTWIYGICVRTAADYRKRMRARRQVESEARSEPTVSPGQEYAVSIRQARSALDRILDAVDADKRAVFVLYEIEELPMSEVAIIVGCPVQTAYSRLHAARNAVEQAVENLKASDEVRVP